MNKHGKRWSDQEILDALTAWAQKHGRPPRWRDWTIASPDHPTAFTVRTRCGGWTDAIVMAGLTPESPLPRKTLQRFPRPEARRLRKQGMSDRQIAALLGVHPATLGRVLGPRPKRPRKPRNAAEAREMRVAALKKALAKNK